MKRWLIFIGSVALISALLYSALQKNLQYIREEKERRAAAALKQPKPAEPAVVPETAQPVETPLPLEPQAPAEMPAVPEKDFVKEIFRVVGLYREANQLFLNDGLAGSEKLFKKVQEEAAGLAAGTDAHAAIKDKLTAAAQARLDALEFHTKVFDSPEAPEVESWWSENVNYLKLANDSIAEVIHMTGAEIEARKADGSDVSSMIEDLQENAKGILVVTKK